MQSEITIKNLKKYFAEIKAVDDISFTVQKGELFGFLGVNGAGKSTTIRMMCTLFSPTDGEIWIGGQQVGVHDEEIRQKIGVVWQENVLDDRLTVKENLQVRAAMYQTKRAWQKNMTIEDRGSFQGKFKVTLPAKPYMAVQIWREGADIHFQ